MPSSRPLFHCVCIQFTAPQAHTGSQQPAACETDPAPSKPLLPLESHVLPPSPLCVVPHSSCPSLPPSLPPTITWLHWARPAPVSLWWELNKVSPLGDTPDSNQQTMYIIMQMCADLHIMRPYSAVQQCSWPGAACWPLSSSRPCCPVSCGHLLCAEPAHPQHWWESGPACWNSAACLTAHPAPEHQNTNKRRQVRFEAIMYTSTYINYFLLSFTDFCVCCQGTAVLVIWKINQFTVCCSTGITNRK